MDVVIYIGVPPPAPLCSSTASARTHGQSLWSPGPCFHCCHEILLGVFTVHANISGVLPSPAQQGPKPCQPRKRKTWRGVPSAQGLIQISHQMTPRTQMPSCPVTTDMGHMWLCLTKGIFYYSLTGGAQGWPGTNQVILWGSRGRVWRGGGIQVLRSDSQACSGFLSPTDVLTPWRKYKAHRAIGPGQHASEEVHGSR